MPAAIAVSWAEATSARDVRLQSSKHPEVARFLPRAAQHRASRASACRTPRYGAAALSLDQLDAAPSWPCIMSGAQKSVSFAKTVPVNDAGRMPMIVNGFPFKYVTRPSVCGSALKCVRHKPVADDDHRMARSACGRRPA